jgi:hypothetical protein
MMMVQCFNGDGSNAGKLFAVMRLRCFDNVATMLVSPTQSRFLQTLSLFIAKQHYKINYNPILRFCCQLEVDGL